MRLCAAQLFAESGSIERNILKHLALVELAASQDADLILFPELSLSGYEPALADDLASDTVDGRLDVFHEWADKGITICVGLPIRSVDGVQIAMIVFQPRGERLCYAKQQLHADEMQFFVPGQSQLTFAIDGHVLAPAICYESLQPSHADVAARMGANIYLASVAKPQRNLVRARQHYARIAEEHRMAVMMANSVGLSDNFVGAGQSAIWNSRGQLVQSMDSESEGLVLFDTMTQTGKILQA